MGLINSTKQHQTRIPIEEKFLMIGDGQKGSAMMIPLADIKDVDFSVRTIGKSSDFTTFYVKTLTALDVGTGLKPDTLKVAAWSFSAPGSDNEVKLAENGKYFLTEWQNALESNTRLYHVDTLGFPYPLANVSPARAAITWSVADESAS